MAQVTLRKVSKVYAGGVVAVKETDLHVHNREFLVVVGPSGCGKSTILRLIAGLEEVTTGEIKIGDGVVNHVPPKDRDIAMVFQNYALYPHMSVFDNMSFGLRLRGYGRREVEHRVRETAAILGIESLLHRRPRELSGDVEVLIAANPCFGLDIAAIAEIRARIVRARNRGAAILLVSEDLDELFELADRIVVMFNGALVYETPVAGADVAVVGRRMAGH